MDNYRQTLEFLFLKVRKSSPDIQTYSSQSGNHLWTYKQTAANQEIIPGHKKHITANQQIISGHTNIHQPIRKSSPDIQTYSSQSGNHLWTYKTNSSQSGNHPLTYKHTAANQQNHLWTYNHTAANQEITPRHTNIQ